MQLIFCQVFLPIFTQIVLTSSFEEIESHYLFPLLRTWDYHRKFLGVNVVVLQDIGQHLTFPVLFNGRNCSFWKSRKTSYESPSSACTSSNSYLEFMPADNICSGEEKVVLCDGCIFINRLFPSSNLWHSLLCFNHTLKIQFCSVWRRWSLDLNPEWD